ncbi:hypothetical protein C8R44DRAFT_740226 [Mycena epipterygia]|nr:hypothetical protein C8R44DRAFT_740226 [Mycena epipterygia]
MDMPPVYAVSGFDHSDSTPIVNRLPYDLLFRIFAFFLGGFWCTADKREYFRNRTILCHICRLWRITVTESPLLWSSFELHTGSNLAPVIFALGLIERVPVYLRTALRIGDINTIHDVMNRFLPIFPQLHMLTILTTDANCVADLASLIRLAPLSNLRRLSLSCHKFMWESNMVARVDVVGDLYLLEALRIRRVCFGWNLAPTFRSLRILVIHDVLGSFAPLWQDWEAIAGAAPNVEKISLRRIGCEGLPDVCTRLEFPLLVELDVHFGSTDDALPLLVSTFICSSLKSLSVASSSTQHLSRFLNVPSNLARVQSLTLGLRSVDPAELHRFFDHVPAVTLLEILRSDSDVMDALCVPTGTTSGSHHLVCPNLATIAVAELDPATFRSFMLCREDSLRSMDHVIFRGGLPGYSQDLEWLEERMAIGAWIKYKEPVWLMRDYSVD